MSDDIERVANAIRYSRACILSGTEKPDELAKAAISEYLDCLIEKATGQFVGNHILKNQFVIWLEQQKEELG